MVGNVGMHVGGVSTHAVLQESSVVLSHLNRPALRTVAQWERTTVRLTERGA
jgi:hypothetical protein